MANARTPQKIVVRARSSSTTVNLALPSAREAWARDPPASTACATSPSRRSHGDGWPGDLSPRTGIADLGGGGGVGLPAVGFLGITGRVGGPAACAPRSWRGWRTLPWWPEPPAERRVAEFAFASECLRRRQTVLFHELGKSGPFHSQELRRPGDVATRLGERAGDAVALDLTLHVSEGAPGTAHAAHRPPPSRRLRSQGAALRRRRRRPEAADRRTIPTRREPPPTPAKAPTPPRSFRCRRGGRRWAAAVP